MITAEVYTLDETTLAGDSQRHGIISLDTALSLA
jgi:hypothetical protein